MDDWISLADYKPKEEQRALIYEETGYISISTYYRGEFIMPSFSQPTHWQHLPPPPLPLPLQRG